MQAFRTRGEPRADERDVFALTPDLLLDTHVVVRWLVEPKRLSRDQLRVIRTAARFGRPLGLSAISLVEIAVIPGARLRAPARDILGALDPSDGFKIVPIDLTIAAEVEAVGDSLRDPNDRVIVATARVHGLRLVTSDQRIIASKLVPVVE
jgi:PIN domain nuclease of toxin-antitoxin system